MHVRFFLRCLAIVPLRVVVGFSPATVCKIGELCEQTSHEQALLQVANVRMKVDAALLSQSRRALSATEKASETMPHSADTNDDLGVDIWSGVDLKRFALPPGERDPNKIYIKVLGNFDTGTHLLRELVLRNLNKSQVVVSDPNQDGSGDCKFWKHSYLRRLYHETPWLLEDCNKPNIIGLAVVRNPLAWLSSVHTKPYDLKNCTAGDDWLTRPCTYPEVGHESLTGVTFSSLAEIWNNWTIDYESVLPQGFSRSLVITYEELVFESEKVLGKIAKLANVSLPSSLIVVNEQVKGDVIQVNDSRQLAMHRIQARTYLSAYSSQDLLDVCSRLDQGAMQRYGYMDCSATL